MGIRDLIDFYCFLMFNRFFDKGFVENDIRICNKS